MGMKSLCVAALLGSALMLAGCTSVPVLNTASGKPEVMIPSMNRAAIKGALLDLLLSDEYSVDRESDFTLTASKPLPAGQSAIYQVLLGNAYSSEPRFSLQFAMAPRGEMTRVMARAFIRMNNGFGREAVNDVTAKNGLNLMNYLNQVKARFDSASAKPSLSDAPVAAVSAAAH